MLVLRSSSRDVFLDDCADLTTCIPAACLPYTRCVIETYSMAYTVVQLPGDAMKDTGRQLELSETSHPASEAGVREV